MTKHLLAAAALIALSAPTVAQEEAAPAPSPNEIIAAAPASAWIAIEPEDLVVMRLAPDRGGNERTVVMQLMPPPFSQGWIENIRTLARAEYWDGSSINRVQDNYVVQWGQPDPGTGGTEKQVPEGLNVVPESEYTTTNTAIGEEMPFSFTNWGNFDWDGNPTLGARVNPKLNSSLRGYARKMVRQAKAAATDKYDDDMISIAATMTPKAPKGWHHRDPYAEWVEIFGGWPMAAQLLSEEDEWGDELYKYWPVHCYGMVGVGRNLSPDTGDGSQLYTVIGQAPRHLDRNIALVGRIVSGMEHLTSLPRGKGPLGFYEDPEKRVPIKWVRLASDLPETDRPAFEMFNVDTVDFELYIAARAARPDPFFNIPAGGVSICNLPVPVRPVED